MAYYNKTLKRNQKGGDKSKVIESPPIKDVETLIDTGIEHAVAAAGKLINERINNLYKALNDRLKDFNDALNDIDVVIDKFKKAVAKDIVDIKATIDDVNTSTAAVVKAHNVLVSDVDDIDEQLTKLIKRVDAIDGDLDDMDKDTTQDIGDLKKAIKNIDEDMDDMYKGIDDIKDRLFKLET